jgi:hypothetical protein
VDSKGTREVMALSNGHVENNIVPLAAVIIIGMRNEMLIRTRVI